MPTSAGEGQGQGPGLGTCTQSAAVCVCVSLQSYPTLEYWSGLPFPPPGDLPHPGIKPGSPAWQANSLPSEPRGKPLGLPGKPLRRVRDPRFGTRAQTRAQTERDNDHVQFERSSQMAGNLNTVLLKIRPRSGFRGSILTGDPQIKMCTP